MALGALPLRDEVEHVDLRKKTESACIKSRLRVHMQAHELDKKAMQERMRMLKQHRMRSRDEKYAGRAGPPDYAEVEAEAEGAEPIEAAEVKIEVAESVGGWDMVDGEEDVHSPRSCHPPCTSRTRARCTVS